MPSPTAPEPAATVCGLTHNQILTLLTHWQREFRLLDWRPTLEIVNPREMPDRSAEVDLCDQRKEFVIRVSTDCESMEELHENLIHELLHVHLWFVPVEQMALEEQAVHAVAPVLARLHMKQFERKKK